MGKDFIKRYSILPLALFMTFSFSVAEASKRSGDPLKRKDEKSKARRVESSGLLKAKDQAEKVRLWHQAADQNDAKAQYWLGVAYFHGQGVEQDQVAGVEWWRKAADQNDAGAQFNLGGAYFRGQGVEQDQVAGVEWWRKAAGQGHAVAQYNLGVAYFHGQGVEQDRAEAARLWHQAAHQNDADAQFGLGGVYFYGEGVEKDQVAGVEWWRKAAGQGHAGAQRILKGKYPEDYQVIEHVNRGLTDALSSSSQIKFSSTLPEVRRNTETEQSKERAPISSISTEFPKKFAPRRRASTKLNSSREKPIIIVEQEPTSLHKLETYLLEKSTIKAHAKVGNKIDQYKLGVLYQQIRALYSAERLKEKHLDKAILWYQQAAAEHKGARNALIDLRNRGLYGNLDKEAMQWYVKAVTSSGLNFEAFIQATLDPSRSFKLSDLIVMELNDRELMPVVIEWGASQKPGATSGIFNPLFDPVRYGKSEGSIMAIDPSGDGEDETAFCVAKRCEDYYFITALGGMAGGYNKKKDRIGNSKEVLTKLANIARAHKIHYILIEKNNDNSYANLLKNELGDDIGIIKWHQSIRKENRIRDTLQPLLKDHRLIIDRKALREDFESEPSKNVNYKFFYQFLTSTTTSSSSSSSSNPRGLRPASHDDRLDAVAMAIKHLRVKREKPRQTEYVEEIL